MAEPSRLLQNLSLACGLVLRLTTHRQYAGYGEEHKEGLCPH